jgi:hypothetical protein
MTFMHVAAATATANIPIVVALQNLTCAATHTTEAEATINARTIGDVTCRINGATNYSYDWIDPTSQAPGSPIYQIKRGFATTVNVPDFNTDPDYGPLQGVWQEVGVLAFWGFMLTGPIGSVATASFTVSIRQGTGPVIDTAAWNLSTTIVSGGGGGGGGGCFTGNMLVLMADGTEKAIADIFAGEIVMSLNTETNQLVSARVHDIMVPRICNIYEIKLSNGKTVETTSEHPFRTADGRWANIDPAATYQPASGGKNVKPNVGSQLQQLQEGMLLRGIEGNAKITKIIDTRRIETVYHLSRVGSHHNFFVEGMCVHNISEEIK